MSSMRTKGKSTIVWILMGMLLLGLGGFGVTNFSGTTVGSIGSVGETDVSADEYLRGIRSEMQGFAAQTGQNLNAEQARAMGIPQTVQARLFAAAALEEEARRTGLSVGDQTVFELLSDVPNFKGSGGVFDPARYTDVLRNEGLTATQFEQQVRMDEARVMLQRAVIGGIAAPGTQRDHTVGWLLEKRDLSWTELKADQLNTPVATPDEETLTAWHKANADRFTAPEIRKMTYAWLTPEMLVDKVQLDEQALRDVYQQRIDEFQQPERRMVERLVFQDEASAAAAKARFDAGEATFEQLANERGLQLNDIYLGEVSEAALGEAGAAVFALDRPGVVGPVQTEFGPALLSMNAILNPLNIPFEEAREDLRAEAAADRAKRQIEEEAHQYEDILAGGATVEDLAEETSMELGTIEYSTETPSDGIAAYQTFRERARLVTAEDFPEVFQLDDGGLFVLRLDEIVPPTLKPFEEVREEVVTDWTAAETRRQLKALADEEEMRLEADAVQVPAEAGPADVGNAPQAAAPTVNLAQAAAVERDTGIEGVPGEVTAAAFRLKSPGDSQVVEAEGRVFIIRLDAVQAADLTADEAVPVREAVGRRLTDSVQTDLFDTYARALQTAYGVRFDSSAVAAADARIQ